MSTQQLDEPVDRKPPFVARMIYRLAVPIILGWVLIAYVLGAVVPPLEQVEKERSVSLIPEGRRPSRP